VNRKFKAISESEQICEIHLSISGAREASPDGRRQPVHRACPA